MRRRREWFTRMGDAYLVLWWVPEGHEPTVAEAVARLEHLREHGPTAEAFTFGEAYCPRPMRRSAGAAVFVQGRLSRPEAALLAMDLIAARNAPE